LISKNALIFMIISIIASSGLFLYNYPDINVLYYWVLNLSGIYIIVLELPRVQQIFMKKEVKLRKGIFKKSGDKAFFKSNKNLIFKYISEYSFLIIILLSSFLGSILFINILGNFISLYSVLIPVKTEIWLFQIGGQIYSFNNAYLMNILSAIFLIGVGEEMLRALIVKTVWHFVGGFRPHRKVPEDLGNIGKMFEIPEARRFRPEKKVINRRQVVADWLALVLSTSVWIIWHMFLHYNPYFIIALFVTGLISYYILRFMRDRYGEADLFIPMLAHSIADVVLIFLYFSV